MSKKETALVTGASSGIGANYAKQLANRGYDLTLVARDAQRLDNLANQLRSTYKVQASIIPADLTKANELEEVLAEIDRNASLSMLVNCAGIGPKNSVLDSQEDVLASIIEINVNALHALTIHAAKAFCARTKGAIINIASVVALMPEKFNGSYCASKSFVLTLTQALSCELALHGVQIQVVLPGFTRTEIFERAGLDIANIPTEMMMDADELVAAALQGFDRGELVTIPSLADLRFWRNFEHARTQLEPYLSLKHPAERYFN